MKKIVYCALMLFILSSNTAADNYKFVTFDYRPYSFTNTNGIVQGSAVDIIKTIMINLGHRVEIQVNPWARALYKAKKGDVDAIFTAYKTAERELTLDYSKNALVSHVVGLYVLADSDITFDGDLLKLKNKRIGTVSTISYGNTFDSIREQLWTERGKRIEHNLKKLMTDRIDIVVSNIYVADEAIKRLQMVGRFKKLSPTIETVDSFIAFSKANQLTELRDQVERELEKIIANGTYAEIMARDYY